MATEMETEAAEFMDDLVAPDRSWSANVRINPWETWSDLLAWSKSLDQRSSEAILTWIIQSSYENEESALQKLVQMLG